MSVALVKLLAREVSVIHRTMQNIMQNRSCRWLLGGQIDAVMEETHSLSSELFNRQVYIVSASANLTFKNYSSSVLSLFPGYLKLFL